jgi:Tfp pilus assembly protein PilF
MDTSVESSAEQLAESLQEKIEGRLQRARSLLAKDDLQSAASELETALSEAPAVAYRYATAPDS